MTSVATLKGVAWASRRRRFAANVRALEQRDAPGAELVKGAAAELERYELFMGADGNFQVKDKQGRLEAQWLDGLVDHKAAEGWWQYDRAKTPMPSAILFEGLGFGWLFLHMLRTTERTYVNYSCAAYVVEGDPLALAMLFHMHDLQEVIGQARVRWFVRADGRGALAALREALAANDLWTAPRLFVKSVLKPAAKLPVEETIQALLAERERRMKGWAAEAEAYYAGKDRGYWVKRFAEGGGSQKEQDGHAQRGPCPTGHGTQHGEKLRVLGITSRYTTVLQHSMAELKAAVEAYDGGNGCEMQVAMEPDDHSAENPFCRMIAQYKPDLIIQISRMRYEHPWIAKGAPYICWDQDNLPCMRTEKATASLDGLTFVAGHGALFGAMHLQWPLRNCIFCHATGMTHRYQAGQAGAEELARYGSDVSYMSHASGSAEALRDSLAERWQGTKELVGLFQAACDEVIAGSRAGRRWDYVGFEDLIARTERALGKEAPSVMKNELLINLTLVADRLFRHETLAWAARWCEARGKRLRIWGQGWEGHATLGKYAAGAVGPGEQAQGVYRASKVNLQIIETGILHSRVLDGWASGGFFLIRQTHQAQEEGLIESMWRIGQWSASEGIETIGELEKRGSGELRRAWETVAGHYRDFARGAVFGGFRIWRELPPAKVLIPGLEEIQFNDEGRFGELADRYIGSEEARRKMLGKIRGALERHLSYDARWRDFLAHLRKYL